MVFLTTWLTLSFSLAWPKAIVTKEIKYEDLVHLVRTNQKSNSLNLLSESKKELTGFLVRSFLPELKVFGGFEKFHSNKLGDHSSNYYEIEARANLFNGMSDYWEEERRQSKFELSQIQNKISYSEMLYEARRSYLKLAEAQKTRIELNKSLDHLSKVFKKVQHKVASGVISKSNLTSLRLMQTEFKHKIKDLDGTITLEVARLKSLLSQPDFNANYVDKNILGLRSSNKKPLPKNSLVEEKFKAKSVSFSSESQVLSGQKLPSIDLVASYKRKPFSEREFPKNSDRDEWAAGIQLTWKMGTAWENRRQSHSSKLKSQASEALASYYSNETKIFIEALKKKRKSLNGSIQDLEKEISLNKNHYSQISSEYLRGVKSTSDLTSLFRQLLELKKHRLDLLFQYHLAQAEIEKIMGSF